MDRLGERLAQARQRIEAAGGSGRVTIVAVTKALGVDAARQAVAAGLDQLGENYAAELQAKADAMATEPRAAGVAWHYLGAVQRQAASLGATVSLWQGVDSAKGGRRVATSSPGARVLVQVNLSGQPQRQGCTWEQVPDLVEDLSLAGLDVRGLMGVSGADPAAEFGRLVRSAAALGLPIVSAGMSADYEIAVHEGATMVRLGVALFGPRPDATQMRR